jgi:hypothetical protein
MNGRIRIRDERKIKRSATVPPLDRYEQSFDHAGI